jgi:hypothetical protein
MNFDSKMHNIIFYIYIQNLPKDTTSYYSSLKENIGICPNWLARHTKLCYLPFWLRFTTVARILKDAHA